MSAWEYQLISRIVGSGREDASHGREELQKIRRWGIQQDDFLTSEGKAIFLTMSTFYDSPDSQGSVFGPQAFRGLYPNFILCDDPSMTTEALCMLVRQERVRTSARWMLQQGGEMLSGDPVLALNKMQAHFTDLQNLATQKVTDVPFNAAFSRSMRQMEMLDKGIDMSCGRWPWTPLQYATRGLQGEDYVVIYGRPKNMKSWVLAWLIAWFYEQRKRLLIYTKEMTADNIFRRVGACLARVRYDSVRLGSDGGATDAERESLYAVERMLTLNQEAQPVWGLSANDAAEGGDTVPWLLSKVELYRPDIVFIDGMYLMSDSKGSKKDHERVRNISRAVRAMNLKTGIPIIATLQANRAAAKNQDANSDEVAFSDAIGQDATLLMRCIREQDKPTIAMVIGGNSREFKLDGFRIAANPAVSFDYYGEITSKEIEQAKEKDTGGNELGNHKVAAARPKTAAKPAKKAGVTEGQLYRISTDRIARTMGL